MNHFITEDQAKDIDPDHLMIVCTGSQGEDWSGLKRLSENEHPKIKLSAGDTVIISARMIVGRERQIYDMINRFVKMGVHTITSETDKTIHVSGHPPQGDLKALYTAIKPHFVIPVHGEYRHLNAHAEVAKSIHIKSYVPDNGELIAITKTKCEKVALIHYGKTVLDGAVIIPKDGQTMSERAALANGCIIIFVMICNKNGTPSAEKHIRFFGVCDTKEMNFKHKIRHRLNDLVDKNLTDEACTNPQKVMGPKIRSEIQKLVFKERGTDPQIFVSILSQYNPEQEYVNDNQKVF